MGGSLGLGKEKREQAHQKSSMNLFMFGFPRFAHSLSQCCLALLCEIPSKAISSELAYVSINALSYLILPAGGWLNHPEHCLPTCT